MRYLLDTCLLSELIKKRPQAAVIDWIDATPEAELHLSVITLGELTKGIERLPRSHRREGLQKWVDEDLCERFRNRILPVDSDTARRWGQIQARCELEGRPIPVLDSLIAATALTYGLTVVTRNVSHLSRSGASLFNPWRKDWPIE